jgi:hypothetical protein
MSEIAGRLPTLTIVNGSTSRGPAVGRLTLTPEEAAEERRLWADYYEAVERLLEIMRREGTSDSTLFRIVAEDSTASRAIRRIKQLHGIP